MVILDQSDNLLGCFLFFLHINIDNNTYPVKLIAQCEHYIIALAISPIIKIPRELSKKEIGIKSEVFILENPIIINPSSSGSGEAIISAPKNAINHLKILKRKIDINRSDLDFFSKNKMSSDNLFLTNRKIIMSPNIAPIPPSKAVKNTELTCAIPASTTVAGATVKIEVKNIPAIKLPNSSSSFEEAKILTRTSVFTKIIAIKTLNAIMATSLIKLFL